MDFIANIISSISNYLYSYILIALLIANLPLPFFVRKTGSLVSCTSFVISAK